MRKIKEKLTREQLRFRREARNQTITLIVTSFSFVAGLAWNEAVKSAIEVLFPAGNGLTAKIMYALFLTLIVVVVSYFLTRLKHPGEEGEVKNTSESNK